MKTDDCQTTISDNKKNLITSSRLHLENIISNKEIKQNITNLIGLINHNYSFLDYADGDITKSLIYKDIIMNITLIMEAIIINCANSICSLPAECDHIPYCTIHFTNKERNVSSSALSKLVSLSIINITDTEYTILQNLIHQNNAIKSKSIRHTDFSSKEYNHSFLDIIYLLLVHLSDEIASAIPYYQKNCINTINHQCTNQ